MDTSAGTPNVDDKKKRHRTAVLHLQPSIRQTVVKTITTTTIHYAPIPLPLPSSPKLIGDYAQDRHSHPLQLAEERRKEALIRAGRDGIDDDDVDNTSSSSSSLPVQDLRQFQVEFGKSNDANKDPIKAIYTLDDTSTTGAAGRTVSPEVVDRKGKGRERHDSVHRVTTNGELAGHIQSDLKRKRRPSQERILQPTYPSSSTLAQIQSDSLHSGLSDTTSTHPPRKKSRVAPLPLDANPTSTTRIPSTGLDTPETASSSIEEDSQPLPPLSPKDKEREVAPEIVLPSPTLSPRLHPEDLALESEEPSEAKDIERQLVTYNRSASSSSSASAREVVSTTRKEEIIAEEGEDGQNEDENQLACLSEGYTMSTLMSLPSLISNYSKLSEKLQLNILYQLLRQSSTPIIQKVNHIIQPALKRDFISDLPAELSLQVLSYVSQDSSKDIIKCLYVCKNWKRFIDSQGQIWSDLLKLDDLWIGGRSSKTNNRRHFGPTGNSQQEHYAPEGDDDEQQQHNDGENARSKPKPYGNVDIENEEADYWSSVGVTKSTFNQSRYNAMRWGRKGTSYKRRKSTSKSKSRSRERGDNDDEAEASRKTKEDEKELDIKDLLSVSDWKSALFLKRWKDRIWDESFDMDEASRPTAEKLAALNDPTLQHQGRNATSNAAPHSASRLRRANTRPRIGDYAPRIGTKSPPSAAQSLPSQVDYIHPLKLIYKKRIAVRSHWFSSEPADTSVHRITFRGTQTSVITSLQFDNEKIVTASDDPTIDVYDTMTGELKMKLEGHDGGIWALQYIGNILVSGSTDRTVRVWDLETGLCTHVFYGHTSTVRCLQIVEPVNGESRFH